MYSDLTEGYSSKPWFKKSVSSLYGPITEKGTIPLQELHPIVEDRMIYQTAICSTYYFMHYLKHDGRIFGSKGNSKRGYQEPCQLQRSG